MKEFGFQAKEGGKNFEAIQPRYVFRLNIEAKTQDEVMALVPSKDPLQHPWRSKRA